MEWYCDAFIIVDSRGAAAATIQSPAMIGMSRGCMVIVIEGWAIVMGGIDIVIGGIDIAIGAGDRYEGWDCNREGDRYKNI